MNTKTILIIAGVAVVGYYFWNKSKKATVVTKGTSSVQGAGEARACHCANPSVSINCGETYGLTQCVECCRKGGSSAVSWGSQRIGGATR